MDSILKSIGAETSILVNGVVNAGKSTFTSCMINYLLTKSDKDVFIMDLDPGQPNYNLAGQVALLRLDHCILTNTDFK